MLVIKLLSCIFDHIMILWITSNQFLYSGKMLTVSSQIYEPVSVDGDLALMLRVRGPALTAGTHLW